MATFFQGFLGLLGRKDRRWPAVPEEPMSGSQASGGWIPLSEAARRMYAGLEGTSWRAAADREPTPEARFDYMAAQLVRHARVEGRSPPASAHRAIAQDELDAGAIKGGGRFFQRDYESYLTFIDMRVREEDLRDVLERMKAAR